MKFFIVFLLFYTAACQHQDDCEKWLIPIDELTCTVTGAGNATYNGLYVYRTNLANGKRQYEKLGINDAQIIIYHATNGWSITHLFNKNDILYYSNSFGENPPDLGSTQWQVLTGTPPGPTVTIGTITNFQLMGTCL